MDRASADDLVEPAYFAEIMSGLHTAEVDVRHFALIASPETLRRRLRTRSRFWPARATGREELLGDAADRALRDGAGRRSVRSTPTTVPSTKWWRTSPPHAGLTLEHPRLGTASYQLRRAAVGIRHIRV
jgi:hypothetical protein